jgi:hypothetical protein
MFSLRILRYHRRSLEKEFDKYLFSLEAKDFDAEPAKVVDDITKQFEKRLELIDFSIEASLASKLIQAAQTLDLQVPPGNDLDMWNTIAGRKVLNPKGRSHLRKLIDAERTRRREVKAWWWKNVVIPAITALTGLAGVITGMIAVIYARK